jgi:GT2 family glycosyltransferase
MNSINVLMLTYNSEYWLHQVLPPLKDDRVRLIVVDGSTDNTLEVIKKYFPDAIIIKNASNNLALLRNLALRESEKHPSEYTAFIDSDMVMVEGFFDRAIRLLESDEKYGVACVAGVLHFQQSATYTARFWRNFRHPEGVIEKDYTCTGATMFKTEAIKGIVIDERCKRSDEDVDLCEQVRKRGYKILEDNNPPHTVHIRDPSVWAELTRYWNFGKTRPITLLKHSSKKLQIHTVLTDAFTWLSIFCLFLIPLYGWICLLPTAMIFGRHLLKLKRKWRVDHVLFSMLLSYIYNCLCGVGLVKYGFVKLGRRNRN